MRYKYIPGHYCVLMKGWKKGYNTNNERKGETVIWQR